MIRLPRGIPVRQNVNPARINLPQAMQKLRRSSFSGCLHFSDDQGHGVVLFQSGQLVSAIFTPSDGTGELIAFDALVRIFEVSIHGHATLNIDQVSGDIAPALHVLLHGRVLQRDLDLAGLDVKKLLQRIREQALTVCLRISAGGRSALVFYDQGHALGFFHEGSRDLSTDADIQSSVAALPGAKLDVVETRGFTDIVLADLMKSVDLQPLWQRAREAFLQRQQQQEDQKCSRSSQ